MGRWLFLALSLWHLVGCATNSARIDDLTIPLNELQRVAQENVPLKVIGKSPNGRELFSDYFVISGGEFEEAEGAGVRHQAVISILGDRRPYSIEVKVIRYRRDKNNVLQQIGQDEGVARVIVRRIQQDLYKRRDNRNVVDDFRVF
jgi:hypothetical protein